MSGLVQRLHTFWPNGFDQGDVPKICEEAADRIEALEARVKALDVVSSVNADMMRLGNNRIEALESTLRQLAAITEHALAGWKESNDALEGKS